MFNHPILLVILLLAAAIGGVVYYKKNQKGTDAIVTTVEKDVNTAVTDVKSTVASAEAIAKKA